MQITDLYEAIDFEKTYNKYKPQLDKRRPKEASAKKVLENLLKSLSSQQQKYPFVKWILDRYLVNDIKKMEDFSRAAVALEIISQKKHLLPSDKRDINRIKNFDELESLKEFLEKQTTGKENKSIEKEKVFKDIDVFYDGPEGKILIPKTEEASCFLGKGTRWCTAATKGYNYFDSYNSEGPLYVILPNDGRKFQIHFLMSEYMNEKDEEIDMKWFIKEYPWVFDKAFNTPDFIDKMSKNIIFNLQFFPNLEFKYEKKFIDMYANELYAWGNPFKLLRNPSDRAIKYYIKQTGKHNNLALANISNPTQEHIDLAMKSVPDNIIYVKNPTDEHIKQVVKYEPYLLDDVNNLSDKQKMMAIKEDPLVIRIFDNNSEEVYKFAIDSDERRELFKYGIEKGMPTSVKVYAVTQYPPYIKNMKNPLVKVQKAAIETDPRAIRYIKSPSPRIVELAKKLRSKRK